MQATDILREEHRWIAQLVAGLAKVVQIQRAGGGLNAGAAEEILTLFELFADGTHQEKEEEVLFPRLLTRVRGGNERLLEGLVREHGEDRVAMARLRSKLALARNGDEGMRREFVQDAEAYVALQNRHMHRESTRVLPLAEQCLTHEDDRQVVEGYRRLERSGPHAAEQVQRRIRDVCASLGLGVPDS